jgi:hypothetical protein
MYFVFSLPKLAQMAVCCVLEQMNGMDALEAFQQQERPRPVGNQNFLDCATLDNH